MAHAFVTSEGNHYVPIETVPVCVPLPPPPPQDATAPTNITTATLMAGEHIEPGDAPIREPGFVLVTPSGLEKGPNVAGTRLVMGAPRDDGGGSGERWRRTVTSVTRPWTRRGR